MKELFVLFGLTLGMAPLSGQTPVPARPRPNSQGQTQGQPPPDNTPNPKAGSVEGVVTNSVNGGPVKKAIVTLRGIQGIAYTAETDAAGHFRVDRVDPGRYTAMAARDGYTFDVSRRFGLADNQISVAEEQNVKDVAVKIMPLGLANGRVLDEDGEPIAGASIQALRYNYSLGRKQLGPYAYASTNDLGEFQMLDLQPGRYYFEAMVRPRMNLPGLIKRQGMEETSYPPTFYPSTLDPGQASNVVITAGGQINNLDFKLKKVVSHHIRGKVVTAEGQAARNSSVQVLPASAAANTGPTTFFAQVQPDGSFDQGGVPSGSYLVRSMHQDSGINAMARQTVSVADQDVEGVLLTLAPGMEISGTLQVDGPDTPPPSTNQGQPAPTPSRVQVALQSIERFGAPPRSPVEADGTFVLHSVMPSVYQVMVTGIGSGKYLKSIRFGDRDVPSGEIDLTNLTAGNLQLIVGTDGGQIEGTVQTKSGDPAPSTMILIAPRDELAGRMDLTKQSSSDASGHFKVMDVAPGTYKVFAWEEYDYATAQSLEMRKALESKATSVTIGANGHESIQVKAISADEVAAEKNKLP